MFIILIFLLAIGGNLAKSIDPEKDLTDKVVIVTGGAQGIGYSIAEHYLKNEAKAIIILDIDEEKGVEAAKTFNSIFGDGKAEFIKCDVTEDIEPVSKYILETYGYVDVLVNNAGICEEDDPRKTITTNSVALIEWSLKFWKHMRKDKGGRGGTIINISSMLGYLIHPFVVTYTSSKYSVIGFSKGLGHDYNHKRTGVRVVVINPGFTHTALTAQNMVWEEHLEDFNKLRDSAPWQSADDVGRGAVQVFQTADTGSAWDIRGGLPPSESPVSADLTLADIEGL